MGVDEQLLNYHLNRLKNKSRDVRLTAVEELRKLGDAAALEPLREVFKTDSDIEVRKAAQAAGKDIFQQSKGDV